MTHMRSVCISQVLGTDMKKHFQILSSFQVPTRSHACTRSSSLLEVWCMWKSHEVFVFSHNDLSKLIFIVVTITVMIIIIIITIIIIIIHSGTRRDRPGTSQSVILLQPTCLHLFL